MWHVLRIDTEDAKQNVSRNYRKADSGYAIGTLIGTPAYDMIAESPKNQGFQGGYRKI